jgi:Pentapeptide repeats (8 copies)
VLEVTSPDWLSWGFWAQDHESIRDLVITIAALVGIPFVIWREWLHHRQTKAAVHQAEIARQQAATAQFRHEAQVEADRERRITDNFTRAVEQLESDKLATRLGGIYILERIAQESQPDHWPIMETLIAYVREQAPWPPTRTVEIVAEGQVERVPPALDVQACLTALGRRRIEHDLVDRYLKLPETDLRDYDLEGVHFENANLRHAHLEGAWLNNAHLEKARLGHAHLEEASLDGTHLERARLDYARLEQAFLAGAFVQEARCFGAHLERADLLHAHFEEARLAGAHLEGAIFEGTHLEGADLSNTDLTQAQFDSAISDEHTKVPPHIKRKCKPAGEPTKVQHEVAATSSK